MQQLSMHRFCDVCGAANDQAATCCVACQAPLPSTSGASPFAPVRIARPAARQVFAGATPIPDSAIAPAHLHAGMVLAGRYRILGEIGRGGFSIVYRAEDLDAATHDEVAIKRIHLRSLTPRQIIDATETFHREMRTLARFKHFAGIPHFYEHLTDAENWYLVMEYIDGQTLEDYLRHAPDDALTERETLDIGIDLAHILHELHSVDPPIIFRDVKPANIMITPDRRLYLIDFGISRVFTPGKKKDTTPIGTPGYAPLEQYGRAQTDARSDIYSLGATLQTLLTGRDPLELAAGEPSRNRKKSSRALRKLLAEMMASDMAQRPANLGIVQRRLEQIQEGGLLLGKRLMGALLILSASFVCIGDSIIFSIGGFPVLPFAFGATCVIGALLLLLSRMKRRTF